MWCYALPSPSVPANLKPPASCFLFESRNGFFFLILTMVNFPPALHRGSETVWKAPHSQYFQSSRLPITLADPPNYCVSHTQGLRESSVTRAGSKEKRRHRALGFHSYTAADQNLMSFSVVITKYQRPSNSKTRGLGHRILQAGAWRSILLLYPLPGGDPVLRLGRASLLQFTSSVYTATSFITEAPPLAITLSNPSYFSSLPDITTM